MLFRAVNKDIFMKKHIYTAELGQFFRCMIVLLTGMIIMSGNLYAGQSGKMVIQDMKIISCQENRKIAVPESGNDAADTPFHNIIVQAADRHDVDPAIIKAIIKAESSYNPRAVSHCGAKGLMQLMPETAGTLGVENIFDPRHNIEGGTKYFRQLLDRFDGDTRLALAAYNAGIRKVLKYNGVPPFRATKNYIRKVLKYYQHYKASEETEQS